MKYLATLLIAVASVFYVSCGKIPTNGDLDGQWQLMEISYPAVTEEAPRTITVPKKDDRIYWLFQLDVLQILAMTDCGTELSQLTGNVVSRFSHKNGQLDITKTYIHYRDRDSLLTDPATEILEPIGITGNAETFRVEHLSNHTMVLSNDKKKLTFRKF